MNVKKKVFLIFIMFSLIITINSLQSEARTNLELFNNALLLLHFDSDLITDSSLRAITGTIFSGAPQVNLTEFQVGPGSMSVYGTDSIDFDKGFMINHTLSFWVHLGSDDGTGTSMVIADTRNGGANVTFFHRWQDPSSTMRYEVVSTSPFQQLEFDSTDIASSLKSDTWTYFCLTANHTGNTVFGSIYRNGTELLGSGSEGMPQVGSSTNITFGTQRTKTAGFDGEFDEIYLFNSSLTSEECGQIFDLGNAGLKLEGIDVTPPDVTIISPINNSFSTSIIQVFNLSIVEPNLDTITLNFNGINETGFINDFENFFSLTKNTMAEGLFTFQIHVNDTVGNEFVSDLLQFTVDNTSPTIVYTFPSPLNTTISNLNNNINILGFNINLNNSNLTVFNSTDEIVFQNITADIGQDTFTFVNSLAEIFLGQPDASYKFRTCFTDLALTETCQEVIMELDTTIAVISTSISNSTPLESELIQINATCTDTNLNLLAVSNNETGTQLNVTAISVSGSLTYLHNHTVILGTIAHQFTCEDSADNSAQSPLITYTSTAIPIEVIPEAVLPLENVSNIAAMIALFLVIFVFFTQMIKKGGK